MARVWRIAVLVALLAACGTGEVAPASAGAATTAPTTTTTLALPELPAQGLAMDVDPATGGVVFLTLDGDELGRVEGVVAYDLDARLPHAGRVDEPDLPPIDDVGHWRYSYPEPGGDRQLAYWSGECESSSAWVIEVDGTAHPIRGTSLTDVPESIAMGWAPDGRAIVSFTEGICGNGSDPGVYLLDLDDPAATPFRVTPLVNGVAWSR